LHTHWDREWYFPYETYRVNLVYCLKEIIAKLENGSLTNFYLDGQALALEDALELAPQLEHQVKSLMASGKLVAGPWYVLADQMLVCGESLIRNLQVGIAEVSKFGQPALIGYCPDTFGHSQDLPRILNGFAIKEAVVWRGVPAIAYNGAKHEPVFYWQSPDGSQVLAYHLARGYSQTGFNENLTDDQLHNALRSWVTEDNGGQKQYTYSQIVDGALYPVGGDHVFPPNDFAHVFNKLKEELPAQTAVAVELKTGSLSHFLDYAEKKAKEAVPPPTVLEGELRDNAASALYERAFLLPGVTSSRLYLKRANRLAEKRLYQISEPLYSLIALTTDFVYPTNELNYAERLLLKNQPHDSICGTSVDDVHSEMITRYKKVNHVLDALDALSERQTAGLAASLQAVNDPDFPADCVRIYNLSNQTLSAPVSLTWTNHAGKVEASGQSGSETGSPIQSSNLQIISKQFSDKLFAGIGIVPYYKFVDEYQGLVFVDDVPPFGYKDIAWPPHADKSSKGSVQINGRQLSNGFLTINIAASGQLEVVAAGKKFTLGHNIVDYGDGGDSYNFDPIPSDVPIKATFKEVRAGLPGPLLGSLLLTYEIEIPAEAVWQPGESAKADPLQIYNLKRSDKLIKHTITTEISLKKGSPIVHFETTWENQSKDHRLEIVFDTGKKVETTYAENHFSLIERKANTIASKLPVDVGCEAMPDRFPCQRFFIANNQLFLNTGLPEYGMEKNTVSLTILRAFSYLSRGRLRTRGGGAGPKLATPEGNCLGNNSASYAWAALPDDKEDNQLASNVIKTAYDLCDQYENKLCASLRKSDNNPSILSLLSSSSPAVHFVALYTGENAKHIFVRLLNTCNEEKRSLLTINFPSESIDLVRLDETVLQRLPYQTIQPDSLPNVVSQAKVVPLEFMPNELVTIRITRV
jgi:alpha-mannosidase/mannosylglycerate hydrolase